MKAVLLAVLFLFLFFGSLSAIDLGGDITPPVLVDASANRLQIDTSNGPQTITFTLHITDDLAGVRSVQIGFRHQLGYNESRECQQWPDPYNRDTTLLCAVEWPQYSAEGKWIVTWLSMSDDVGNWTDGNVADCVRFESNRCTQFAYNENATEAIRAIETLVVPAVPGEDPPLYLPLVIR